MPNSKHRRKGLNRPRPPRIVVKRKPPLTAALFCQQCNDSVTAAYDITVAQQFLKALQGGELLCGNCGGVLAGRRAPEFLESSNERRPIIEAAYESER